MKPLKIVLLGTTNVGKTSIIHKFCVGNFNGATSPTIQVASFEKTVDINNQQVKLNICDTAGQERYQSICPNFYRDADAILVVFSLDNKETLDKAQNWFDELNATMQNKVPILTIGNKNDLIRDPDLTREKCIHFAMDNNSQYIETSAKENIGIDTAFITAADCAMKNIDRINNENIALEQKKTNSGVCGC